MKTYKKWLYTLTAYTTGILFLIVLLNYLIDPLQFYRQASYEPQYSKQQRYQNPGLAKNYDYDRVIIGSSMTENFVPSYVDTKLGGKTLKLSIEGSSLREQAMISEIALDTGKVKQVLWGVDYFSLRGDPQRVRDEQGEFPYFLYDHNLWNDVRYLLNLDTTMEVWGIIGTFFGFGTLQSTDLDQLYNWNKKYSYGKSIVLKEWAKFNTDTKVKVDELEYPNIKASLDQNLISQVKSHPDVKFIFYYPPYTILQHRYYYDRNPLLFQYELDAKAYLFSEIGHLPNVVIYDFQHIAAITYNLDHYKDLAHHDQSINQFIIDAITSGEYLVTAQTLAEYADQLTEQVQAYSEVQLQGVR